MEKQKKSNGKFLLVDFFVILLCLSGTVCSVNLFWTDLFQTLNAQNRTPIGTVNVKKNIVQRRMSDRVIWDRLIRESPVYSNDLIRVGDNSEIDLHVGGNSVTINENTLLRLRYDKETDNFQIDLTSGSIGLDAAPEGGGVVLNIMGKQMKAAPGTALNAAAGDNGVVLQVSKGSAAIITEEGQSREIGAGDAILMDSEGSIRSEPAAFVIQPKPNALYRNNSNEPLTVVFSWNRINFQPDATLRLEIAEDQYFTRSVRTLNGLNDSAQAALSAGLWNWRLTYNGAILDWGRFTITDAERFELLSPARNRQFFYETEPPKLYFQWSQMEDALYYIAEVDVTPEFRNPIIKKQITAVSFSDASLGEGIWYWRVTPVFSQANEGAYGGIHPHSSFFRIVKSKEPVPSAGEPDFAHPGPVRVTLESPADKTILPGLTARRQQTIFRWSSDAAVAKSRFVLSQNANPLAGRAVIEIPDPNRIIRIDRLNEGVWYWTVEAHTPEGINISAQAPRQLQVLPVPLLPAPAERQPADGYRIGIEELQKVTLHFRWSAVQGANRYIFTLYQEITGGRRQITQIGPENRTAWSTDIKALGRGNFIWRIEAVNAGYNNIVDQRGIPMESRFVIDIPRADPVKIIDAPGVTP